MEKDELREILDEHIRWLADEGGKRADLCSADLRGAYLRGADLRGAYLCGADLRRADLSRADLSRADLRDADLRDANLSGIVANEYTTGYWLACPSTGAFVGWKKCNGDVIVELLVPADAKRSSATSRKCRAEFVDVIAVHGGDVGVSSYNGKTEYRAGKRVMADSWDADRWNECSNGIHFFITREEAEQYR